MAKCYVSFLFGLNKLELIVKDCKIVKGLYLRPLQLADVWLQSPVNYL